MALAFTFLAVDKSSADLTVGGAYIIGWHGDTQESLAFVLFENMDAGEQLFFTDSGFFASGDLRGVETVMTWTATSAAMAGTVVTLTNSAVGNDAIADEGVATGELDLRINGDQVFIGNTPFPTTSPGPYDHSDLIFGFDYDTVAGWDPTATGPRTSALPSVLTEHNVAFDHVDNGVYIGPRSGLTVSQYQAAIRDEANWSFSNARADINMDSTDFKFSTIPEPTGLACILLLSVGLTFRRSRQEP